MVSGMGDCIYMNNAATGWPKAPGVAAAVARALEEPPAAADRAFSDAGDAADECRRLVAKLLGGVEPERVVLATNATHALNLAILGLGLGPGAHVVTSATEHNSVLRPLHHLLHRHLDLTLTAVGLDRTGAIDTEVFAAALAREPDLVVLNHASNVTGRVNPVDELFAAARAAGAVTLLDTAQSLGQLSVDARALGADLVAFTGHKGLHGPPGTGGLYVGHRIELEQVLVGGTGMRSDLRLQPPEMPVRLEAGTPNLPALAGLAAALRWHAAQGKTHQTAAARLADRLRDAIRELPGVTLVADAGSTTGPLEQLPIVSLVAERWSVEELGHVLGGCYDIVGRTGLHCAPLIHEWIGSAPDGTVRLSPSGFNSDQEIERVIQALGQLTRCESRT